MPDSSAEFKSKPVPQENNPNLTRRSFLRKGLGVLTAGFAGLGLRRAAASPMIDPSSFGNQGENTSAPEEPGEVNNPQPQAPEQQSVK